MKNSKILTISSILILASCQFISKKPKTNDPSQTVVSKYNGGEITIKDATNALNKIKVNNEKLKNVTFDKLNSEQKEVVVKEAVFNEIAYEEAKKRNLNNDEDYKEALKIFETELLKQKLLIDIANKAKEEKNVRKNYDELAAKLKGKKDFKISYISLNTKNDANSLHKDLIKNPSSFSSQAKKKSIDKETAKKGGALGYVVEDSLPKEITKIAKTLKKGQISQPIAVSDKWVIIKLENSREAEVLSYDKAKESLANNLAKKAVKDFISQSLDKAKIVTNK